MYSLNKTTCSYCGLKNHRSKDCRYKINNIKCITRVNGKLQKTYTTHARNGRTIEYSFKSEEKKNNQTRYKDNSQSKAYYREANQEDKNKKEEITFIKEIKKKATTNMTTKLNNKISPTNQTNIQKKCEENKINIKPNYLQCKECLKWEIRLQENMKIVQSLTKEIMQLNEDKKDLDRRRQAWKLLCNTNIEMNNDLTKKSYK